MLVELRIVESFFELEECNRTNNSHNLNPHEKGRGGGAAIPTMMLVSLSIIYALFLCLACSVIRARPDLGSLYYQQSFRHERGLTIASLAMDSDYTPGVRDVDHVHIIAQGEYEWNGLEENQNRNTG